MKKIYLVLSTGQEILVGYATSLYDYLLEKKKKSIVPLHGHIDYMLVHNLYSKKYKQFVTYKAIIV